VFESEIGHDLIPVRCVAEDGSCPATASRSDEESSVRSLGSGFDSFSDHVAYFRNERYDPGTLAFGALVDEPTG
jgi:hypothetical protein